MYRTHVKSIENENKVLTRMSRSERREEKRREEKRRERDMCSGGWTVQVYRML
jgi:hypothetical protein